MEGYLRGNSKYVSLHFLTMTKLPGIDNLNEEYLSPMHLTRTSWECVEEESYLLHGCQEAERREQGC